MSSSGHQTGYLQLVKSMWLVLCVCFALASVAMPAYSAQKMLPNILMSESLLVDDGLLVEDGFLVDDGFLIEDVSLVEALHHSTIGQQHHVEHASNSPCDDPGCDDMSDCSDQCTMNTCCSSPSAYSAYSNHLRTEHLNETVYRHTGGLSVISSRQEPFFRPPIL